MNFCEKLENRVKRTGSLLCIGLDPEPDLIPEPFGTESEGIFLFLREVIEATAFYASAMKPNLSYFEALGVEGFKLFERVLRHDMVRHFEKNYLLHIGQHGFRSGVTVSPLSPLEEKKSPLSSRGGQNQPNLLYFIQRE